MSPHEIRQLLQVRLLSLIQLRRTSENIRQALFVDLEDGHTAIRIELNRLALSPLNSTFNDDGLKVHGCHRVPVKASEIGQVVNARDLGQTRRVLFSDECAPDHGWILNG